MIIFLLIRFTPTIVYVHRHHDRIVLGNSHVFRVQLPWTDTPSREHGSPPDWHFAIKEKNKAASIVHITQDTVTLPGELIYGLLSTGHSGFVIGRPTSRSGSTKSVG